jgi:spermidine synthase
LGLGTGTFCSQCLDYYPQENLSFDGVEIDQKIVDLVYQYFDLPKSINVFVEDGRAYLNNCKKKYDVIMVDAYRDITIPFQMSTLEFFTSVKDHLNEGGNMIVNMNMQDNKSDSIDKYLAGPLPLSSLMSMSARLLPRKTATKNCMHHLLIAWHS